MPRTNSFSRTSCQHGLLPGLDSKVSLLPGMLPRGLQASSNPGPPEWATNQRTGVIMAAFSLASLLPHGHDQHGRLTRQHARSLCMSGAWHRHESLRRCGLPPPPRPTRQTNTQSHVRRATCQPMMRIRHRAQGQPQS